MDTNSSSLSSDQLQLVGSRARAWLLRLCEQADRQTPLSNILQILVGCWICEKALTTDIAQPGCPSMARVIQRRLDMDLGKEGALSALLSCDAALVLLSAGILRALGSESATIELFIQRAALSIQMHKDEDEAEAGELFAARFLLHKLHLHPPLGMYRINAPQILPGTNLFQADLPVIRSLSADIAAATTCGQRPPSAEPEPPEATSYCATSLDARYFRQYNLEIGTLLLRSTNYLGLRADRAFQMGLTFVLAQQQVDGRFGFLAPEISRLRSIKPNLDDVFDIYLPLTVSCLWAIAEATYPTFILFCSSS